jgi:hypothetical protein
MAKQKTKDEISITIKLAGEPTAVVGALANGLPREALEQLRDRMGEEIEKRRANPAPGRRRVKVAIGRTIRK